MSGTFLLVVFGSASTAQSVLSLHHHGNALTVSWARGAGVALGMTVAGGVSGGHLNPALTLAVASLGKFPWAKVRLTVSCPLL